LPFPWRGEHGGKQTVSSGCSTPSRGHRPRARHERRRSRPCLSGRLTGRCSRRHDDQPGLPSRRGHHRSSGRVVGAHGGPPVQVNLVWDPPWDPSRMSGAARRLGWT
jgi:hypothetical protein